MTWTGTRRPTGADLSIDAARWLQWEGELSFTVCSFRLRGLDRPLVLRCQCGKRLDELGIMPIRSKLGNRVAGVVIRGRNELPAAVTQAALGGRPYSFPRARYRCPMRKCGVERVWRRDTLTIAAAKAVEAGRSELVVGRDL